MRSPLPPRRPVAGFTLIELMVTITIAAIIGSIAVSSYTSQVRKSRRTEARQALLDLASREERFFSTNSTYTTSALNLGYTGTFPQPIGNNYYQVSICVAAALPCTGNAAIGSVYLLTATAINTQTKDTACLTFSVDSSGQQTATTTGTCWN